MSYTKWLIVLTLSAVSLSAWSQKNIISSLEQNIPGQGKVRVFQDERITKLIAFVGSPSSDNVIKCPGYRVQLFAGNNTRNAKNEANEIARKIKQLYPELVVYTSFIPPRWICKVGDYKTIEEADAVMRQIKSSGLFKEVLIVRDQVNIPL